MTNIAAALTKSSVEFSLLLFICRCSFLRGRKFPGTVRLTRTGDDSPAKDAKSSAPPGAVQTAHGQALPSSTEDRQTRSLHGEPSTSNQVPQLSVRIQNM